jgi:hypothetical protein
MGGLGFKLNRRTDGRYVAENLNKKTGNLMSSP